MGSPLKLIQYDPVTGKFVVGEEAVKVLRSVKGPVGVVSMCGRARQGKSYILNQLLGRSGGFEVASTHRPCTKGLWLWSTPILRDIPNGTGKYHLVLLDTEGISAYDQTGQYSTQIFSLAVLLSSLFVYNQMGGIDEAAIDQLALVTEMTKKIRMKAEEGSRKGGSLGDFSPSFLWLLRDFYLDLVEDGHKIDANEYLEITLKSAPGSSGTIQARNQMRDSIKELFPSRGCASLVRPVNDEGQLKTLHSLDPRKLRPEFRTGVEDLTQRIFNSALPKRIGNHYVTGAALAGLAEAYVAAINNGAVPVISTAWQSVAQSECLRAADAAEAAYSAAFPKEVSADEKLLEKEHQRALAEARRAYADLVIGDQETRDQFMKRFEDGIDKKYQLTREKKFAEAAADVEALLSRANSDLQKAIHAGISPVNLHVQMKTFVDEFKDFTAGPTKWESLCKFLWDVYGAALVEWLEDARKEMKKARTEASSSKKELSELKTRNEGVFQEVQALRHELVLATEKSSSGRSKQEFLEKELASHKKEFLAMQKELSEACSEGKGLREDKDQAERVLSRAQREAAEAREREKAATAQLQSIQGEFLQKIRQLEDTRDKEAREHYMLKKQMEDEVEDSSKTNELLEALRSEKGELQKSTALLRERCSQAEAKCHQIEHEGQHLNSAVRDKDSQLSRLRDEIHQMQSKQEGLEHTMNLKVAQMASEREGLEFSIAQARSELVDARKNTDHEQQRREEAERINQELRDRIEAMKQQMFNFEAEAEQAFRTSPGGKRKRDATTSQPEDGTVLSEDPHHTVLGQHTLQNVESMTISEIKKWLNDHDCHGIVWDLGSEKKTKKADWIRAIKSKMESTR